MVGFRNSGGTFPELMAKRMSVQQPEDNVTVKRCDSGLRYDSEASGDLVTACIGSRQDPVELQAFGLEDRAEAVIASGKANWSLTNLNKWRHEAFTTATAAKGECAAPTTAAAASREYLKQRQRAYRQQILQSRNPI